mgnify:FL=1
MTPLEFSIFCRIQWYIFITGEKAIFQAAQNVVYVKKPAGQAIVSQATDVTGADSRYGTSHCYPLLSYI